jgi:hypothetical protein
MRSDSKKLVATANQHEFLAIDLTSDHTSIAQIANGKSIFEIGFILLCLCHDVASEAVFDHPDLGLAV